MKFRIFFTMLVPVIIIPIRPVYAEETKDNAPIAKAASAEMESRSGSKVSGKIDFTDSTAGVQVHYNLNGLAKNKKHGFHIHEKGDCSSMDAKSAGSHYKKMEAGGGTSKQTPDRFAGDLPEIKADKKGHAEGTILLSQGGLNTTSTILDRAIMVHGGPDDVTKDSPPRIACGVIKKVEL